MQPNGGSLLQGFVIQCRVVKAMAIRDMIMRYGRTNIGFAWVVLEPMFLTSGVMVIWSLTRGGGDHGIKVLELVLTGYLPLTLWRHLTNYMILIFRRTAGLLYHPSITLFDILLARQVLEILGTTLALFVIWGILTAAGMIGSAAQIDLMLIGWLIMAWLGATCGALIAAATELWESGERIIQPMQYIIIPISGAFFMVEWLPHQFRDLVLFMPTVHCYELFRAGFLGDAVTAHYSIPYACSVAFVLTFLSFVAVHRVRSRVQLT